MDENENFICNVWMSDEGYFYPDGFVNKQNCHFWSEDNPRQFHQQLLNSDRITVRFHIMASLACTFMRTKIDGL